MIDNKKYSHLDIQHLQVWYRIVGFVFGILGFIGLLVFFSINTTFLNYKEYTILVMSTLIYITIPTIVNLAISHESFTPFLYEEINKQHNRYRWIEYVFSASIMMISISILIGIKSLYILSIMAMLMSLTIIFGAISDLVSNKKLQISTFAVASLIFSGIWLYLFRTFILSRGENTVAIVGDGTFRQLIMLLILFTVFPLLFIIEHFSGIKIKYSTLDKFYIISGFFTKAFLFFITLLQF